MASQNSAVPKVPGRQPGAGGVRIIAEKLLLAALMALAVWTLVSLLIGLWSQASDAISKLVLVVGFGVMFSLLLFQIGMAWYLNLRFKLRQVPEAAPGLSVDVFVTTLNEPLSMIESTLRAAAEMRYPHDTFVLDDGGRAEIRELAKRLGVHYLSRSERTDFKAGNVNHALGQTTGEFIAIFDVDHQPRVDFLDRTLGFFADPNMGFVQVMNTFSNVDRSVFARAAAETAFDYYNIGAVGKDQCGAASLMGSNAVIRRQALVQSGLYRPGLAEDLETSLALHSHGWKSAYVREPLAPGHAPADVLSFFKQQLKWSSGVFTAAIGSIRSSFHRLTLQQKLCYLTRFTYYLHGVLAPLHLLGLAVLMIWPIFDIESFSRRMLPFTVLVWLTGGIVPLRLWALEPAARKGLLVRGSSLFLITWPAYVLSFLAVVTGREIPFLETPKVKSLRLYRRTVLPQLALWALLLIAFVWRAAHWSAAPMPVTLGFAGLALASHWILFVALWRDVQHRAQARAAVSPEPDGRHIG